MLKWDFLVLKDAYMLFFALMMLQLIFLLKWYSNKIKYFTRAKKFAMLSNCQAPLSLGRYKTETKWATKLQTQNLFLIEARQLHLFLNNVSKIINATDAPQLDTRHVLKPTHSDHDDVVLLEVVTFPGNIGNCLLATWKSNQNTLSVSRIWLFWFFDDWPNDNGFGSSDIVTEDIFVRSEMFFNLFYWWLYSNVNLSNDNGRLRHWKKNQKRYAKAPPRYFAWRTTEEIPLKFTNQLFG